MSFILYSIIVFVAFGIICHTLSLPTKKTSTAKKNKRSKIYSDNKRKTEKITPYLQPKNSNSEQSSIKKTKKDDLNTESTPINPTNQALAEHISTNPNKVLYAKKDFMTAREREFYSHLELVIGIEYKIMCQVRLIDIIDMHPSIKNKLTKYNLLMKAARWHCDFVILDEKFNIMCAIELDDSTHDLENRVWRDIIFNKMFLDARIHLIRYKSHEDISRSDFSFIR
ncbi:DUF2726 domain-containing protein [Rosenbergiella collisarenosi]|uniref:DUF2726 domain-containing protein n=1 Tax=Rosenbergiella collisarenosi TaxID=1544695 RepID=UPI001F4E860B|nr:DUF2726 domain-containing protein [Rosenbergiella collisarenosi]